MNEKEKKAIEYIKELDITRIFYDNPPSDNHVSMGGAIEILLNLIENQEAEIEDLELKIQTQKELLKMKTNELEHRDKRLNNQFKLLQKKDKIIDLLENDLYDLAVSINEEYKVEEYLLDKEKIKQYYEKNNYKKR